MLRLTILFLTLGLLSLAFGADASHEINDRYLRLADVFDLEYASDPRISPTGSSVAYERIFFDIMTDRRQSNVWIVNSDGTDHRPLTTGKYRDSSPRWSPDESKIAYISNRNGKSQIWVHRTKIGQDEKLTDLLSAPSAISWSPDGKQIAFSMFVGNKGTPYVEMPPKPEGAVWAAPPKLITRRQYRRDGSGYVKDGFNQIFVIPAGGGTPRQLTSGPYNHPAPAAGSPRWTPDGKALIFSANRNEDWEYQPANTEIHEVSVAGRTIKTLTNRFGPDSNPVISPDGSKIAYVGYDNHYEGYQRTGLYVMNRDGSKSSELGNLDRDVVNPTWSADSKGIFFQYDDQGDTKIAYISLDGKIERLAGNLGGATLGRPYGRGSFSAAGTSHFAYTWSDPRHPGEVAVGKRDTPGSQVLTALNDDVLGHKTLGDVEELWYESSFDERKIQGWIVKPPDFDASKKYPFILEIHGGPRANYGPRFTAEIQLYAAAGYVVLYVNPRGSTSYGSEFAKLIDPGYPSQDHDDLMSGVDAILAEGYVDPDRLFITGGSAGGLLSSWAIGKTDRFRAAVVAKPVMNWFSKELTTDSVDQYKYVFGKPPWEDPEKYFKHSPISLVGNVKTPTMVMVGESDHRTPPSEAEQFYQALKLQKVDTVFVRIPGASHDITARPSNLIGKVAHVLKWFADHGGNN